MALPNLYLHASEALIENNLSSCNALSRFSLLASAPGFDWVDDLMMAKPVAAIIEFETLSREDVKRLPQLVSDADFDLILISSGKPNSAIDELITTGSVFHFRHPVSSLILDETLEDIANYVEQTQGSTKSAVIKSDLDQYGLLVGSSRVMHELYRTLRRVARSDANVLIVGESGAGKELVANTLHLASERKDKPFIAINCGAISPELIDSELFGHEKGSFTGAIRQHDGVFKQAQGGTLFLDEVTEMPIEQQVKLLRVLENNEYRPVGSQQTYQCDVRIVAATNRVPAEAIEEGFLREDLYFRLAQFPVNIPPLRERDEDIVGLAKYFLAHRNAQDHGKKALNDCAIAKIADYYWPGNVRELKHCVERAYILADDVITKEHIVFDDTTQNAPTGHEIPASVPLEEIEKAAIINTLNANDGNKTDTAQDLGISVKTLYNKLERYQKKADG